MTTAHPDLRAATDATMSVFTTKTIGDEVLHGDNEVHHLQVVDGVEGPHEVRGIAVRGREARPPCITKKLCTANRDRLIIFAKCIHTRFVVVLRPSNI